MSSISVNTITDASGGSTTSINGFTPTVSNMAGRNRIINGDMRIDQRNAGASVTATNGAYTVDRWLCTVSQSSKFTVQQNAGSVTPPAGYVNYLGCTSSSAYSVTSTDFLGINQRIEGVNTADFGWGSANAKTVTLSFWVRSSLTGTFGGSLMNSGFDRSYPFTYTISSANTWEQKSITIAGDTSGTWLSTNGVGVRVFFSLGCGSTRLGTAGAWTGSSDIFSATGETSVVGTSGATFYITGVQLEEGSVATPFEHRQYGQELALCQRYYYVLSAASNQNTFFSSTSGYTSTQALCVIPFSNTMRTNPSLVTSGTASDYRLIMGGSFLTCSSVPTMDQPNPNSANLIFTVSSGIVVGYGGQALANNTTSAFLGFSAEL